MSASNKNLLLGIGNIYVETNYLNLHTADQNSLEAGKEYRADSYEVRLGGSVTNFVLQAKALGNLVGLIGKIGKDEYGSKLFQLLKQSHISTDFIIESPDVQTCIDSGLVLSHNHQNVQIVSGNANQMIQISDINLSDPIFSSVEAVYVGGFLKQDNLYKNYPELLRTFRDMGIKIFMDHGRIPVTVTPEKIDVLLQSLSYCDGYFPNEEEILGISNTKTLDEALEKMIDIGFKFIAVKRGHNGCRVKSKLVDYSEPAHSVEVISTVGAGDAFNAGFVTEYLRNPDLKHCLHVANKTASLRISLNTYPNIHQVQSE